MYRRAKPGNRRTNLLMFVPLSCHMGTTLLTFTQASRTNEDFIIKIRGQELGGERMDGKIEEEN